MSVKLYVGNLSFSTTSDELQQLFAQAGTVESATVVEDRDTGRSNSRAYHPDPGRDTAFRADTAYFRRKYQTPSVATANAPATPATATAHGDRVAGGAHLALLAPARWGGGFLRGEFHADLLVGRDGDDDLDLGPRVALLQVRGRAAGLVHHHVRRELVLPVPGQDFAHVFFVLSLSITARGTATTPVRTDGDELLVRRRPW